MLTSEALRIVTEAKRRGMWLYDPSYHKWYSPEDFEHTFNYANANEEFLKQLQIKPPSESIKAGFHQLNELHNKVQFLVLRIIEYYRKHPK